MAQIPLLRKGNKMARFQVAMEKRIQYRNELAELLQKKYDEDDDFLDDSNLLLSSECSREEAARLKNDVTFELVFTPSISSGTGKPSRLDESFSQKVTSGTLSRVVVGGASEVHIAAGKPALVLKTALPGSSSVLEIEVRCYYL